MNIFVYAHLDEAGRQILHENLAGHTLYFADKHATVEADLLAFQKAKVVFGNVPPDWLPQGEALNWLQLESVGFGEYLGAPLSKQRTSNIQGFSKDPVAETVLAGILCLYRGMDQLMKAQQEQTWRTLSIRPSVYLLSRANVMVMGTGSIGQRVIELLAPFGCAIQSYSRDVHADLQSIEALDAVLPEIDILIGCLPHTPETVNLLSQSRLAACKRGALIVNVGRGSLIDQDALVDTLHDGQIGGAVIDVMYSEPLPGGHSLWTCPNTLITQYTAGGYDTELQGKSIFFVDNLERYLKGDTLINLVDFARGY